MSAEFIAELLTFVVMVVVIGKFGWPPIKAAAEKQQDHIAAALDLSEQTRAEVATALAESQQQLDEARSRADEINVQAKKVAADEAEDIRVKADREVESFLAQAKTQIAAERDRAIQELRRETGYLVVETAGRALTKALTDKGHRVLIDEGVGKLARSGVDRN